MNWGDAIGAIRTFEGKLVQVGLGGGGVPTGSIRAFGCLQRGDERGKFLLRIGDQVTTAVFEIAPATYTSAELVDGLLLITAGTVEIAIQEAR